MDFRFKSSLQWMFSKVPGGHRLNYLFQRYVTRSYPCTDEVFKIKVNQALLHHSNFKEFERTKSPKPEYYEFGAGWDLIIPITMQSLGFSVHCIDLRRLVLPDLINDTISKFNRLRNELPTSISLNTLIKQSSDIEKVLQIKYSAPLDARSTQLPANQFDFMSSTSTMEHIPSRDIEAILCECHRMLKSGGVLSMLIDYQDHWSYFDPSISVYNFLTYSAAQWNKFNPDLHYQNRMRHKDYMAIIHTLGFEVVKEIAYPPSHSQAKQLQELTLSEDYSEYSFSELGITGSELVLRKL